MIYGEQIKHFGKHIKGEIMNHKWKFESGSNQLTLVCIKCGARKHRNFHRESTYSFPTLRGEIVSSCHKKK